MPAPLTAPACAQCLPAVCFTSGLRQRGMNRHRLTTIRLSHIRLPVDKREMTPGEKIAAVGTMIPLIRPTGSRMMKFQRILFSLAASISLAAFAGCGSSTGTTGNNNPPPTQPTCTPATTTITAPICVVGTPVAAGPSFTGTVLAGVLPVVGASVQLYAAGAAGNGSAPTALLSSPASTGANGSFTIPAGYACPSAQTPLYLLSKGGQPGAAANPSLWLMSAIGPCGSISSGSSFIVNEVSTAASVWALASFMSAGGDVGSSCSNVASLDNAFATAASLANPFTGTSPGTALPSTLTVPSSKLNTLANALASCTQSSGGSACPGLFNAALSGTTVPTNTLDAALNIAHAPGANVAAVYALASGSPVFSPALSAAPPDWMLENTITGGGMANPTALSIAASGDVWVASYFNAVSEFTPSGAAAIAGGVTGSGINESYGMAVDVQGNVWIANEQTSMNSGQGDVAELDSSGHALTTGITGGGLNFPIAVTADTNGNMWFVDYGDSKVTLLSDSGSPVSPATGWGGSLLEFPVALAVDADHNAWVANQGGLFPVTRISPDGSSVTNFNCNCNGASGIATDQSGDVWMANYYGNSISEVNTCGTMLLDAATGGGIDHPQGIAVDGAGTVWVANFLTGSLSEIGGAKSSAPGAFLSPSSGFGTDAALSQPYSLAIDSSGSVWVSNFGESTITQFIGIAAPVKTPLLGPPQLP